MKKYQQLAQQQEQIALGVLATRRSVAFLREQVVSSGMSFMTVSHAYQLLESQGGLLPARSPATTWRQNRSDFASRHRLRR
jgi:DNA-binding transcriptional MocR family regulator